MVSLECLVTLGTDTIGQYWRCIPNNFDIVISFGQHGETIVLERDNTNINIIIYYLSIYTGNTLF